MIFADVAVSRIGVGAMPLVGDVAKLLGQQLALDLAERISAHFAPPDTWGTVEVFSGDESATFELSKNSNTYTPVWGRAIPNVPIHKSTIAITLKDSDLLSSQHMARITLDEARLLELEEAGGTVALDTRAETGGALYRLFIRVEESPR